jgi:hypothetical protein
MDDRAVADAHRELPVRLPDLEPPEIPPSWRGVARTYPSRWSRPRTRQARTWRERGVSAAPANRRSSSADGSRNFENIANTVIGLPVAQITFVFVCESPPVCVCVWIAKTKTEHEYQILCRSTFAAATRPRQTAAAALPPTTAGVTATPTGIATARLSCKLDDLMHLQSENRRRTQLVCGDGGLRGWM